MNIGVIGGTGYVGLVTAVCLAELGNTVTCLDVSEAKIAKLDKGQVPFYEPGLTEMLERGQRTKRLHFTTDPKRAITGADILFITVGTPSLANGEADLSQVRAAAQTIGKNLAGYAVVVNKSTVPVGTGNLVYSIIESVYDGEFDVVSNPEFLREGQAVRDCMEPDRIVIGNGSKRAQAVMEELYAPFNAPIVHTDVKTAELIKYASNAFLAASISFINSIAAICEEVGADVTRVAEGMRLDRRIGQQAFLQAGIGYGGSCFPKDVRALVHTAETAKLRVPLLDSIEGVNIEQRRRFMQKIKETVGSLAGKRVAVWGLAFKPHTDDLREAPSLEVLSQSEFQKAQVVAYDPVVKEIPLQEVQIVDSPYAAVEGAEVLLIFTDWDEFKQIDLAQVAEGMANPCIIDGRNLYDLSTTKRYKLTYVSIGRPASTSQGY